MSDQKKFKHGGVTYPLDDALDNELLKDADPALHYAIQLFVAVIKLYVGPRLLAQAAAEGLRFPSAVEKTLHYEPLPFLLNDEIKFPLFCLYRSEEAWNERTVHYTDDVATWEWAFVLPPLTPRQREQLHPILRSVAVVVREFAHRSWDPTFEDTKTLRDLSNIEKMLPGPTRYGGFEHVTQQDKYWSAAYGKLLVLERDDVADGALEPYEGAHVTVDATTRDGAKEEALFDGVVGPAPVVESVAPSAGTKAGAQPVEVFGRNFVLGTTPLVLFGGAYASNVRVTHPRRITCLTPAYDAAQPSQAVGVQVIDAQGQPSEVLADAYTFTAP